MYRVLIHFFWNSKHGISDTTQSRNPQLSPMNEGDVHSGPRGYSPNTAYTETQYGSRFNEDAVLSEEL